MKSIFLVCYDVRDDKRLRQVARVLEGFGRRLQLSVFECRLSDRDIQHLRWRLSKVMGQEDRLLIAGLCKGCASKVMIRNWYQEWPGEDAHFVIV